MIQLFFKYDCRDRAETIKPVSAQLFAAMFKNNSLSVYYQNNIQPPFNMKTTKKLPQLR